MEKLLFTKERDYTKFLKNRVIFNFCNNHDLYWFNTNPLFKKSIIGKENINFVDGFAVSLFLSLFNLKKVRRYRGPILSRHLLDNRSLLNKKKIFFIGLEKKDLPILIRKYPYLSIKNLFAYNPPYIKDIRFPKEEVEKIVKLINSNKADYVFISIGCPKQNILAHELYKKTRAKCILNVGAALDFILEKKKESQGTFQKIGLEWLYRLFTDFKKTRVKVWRSFVSLLYINSIALR